MAITRRRRLKSGVPVWTAYRFRPPRAQAPLSGQLRTEVLVIGAGISGSLVAWELARRGHKVIIVDRRGAVQGSTAASTALLQFEIDVPLSKLGRRIGRHAADRVWLRSRMAVDSLATAVKSEHIAAAMRSRPSLYLAGTQLNAAAMRREAAARARIGLPSQLLGRRELASRFGITRAAAILSHGNLIANPRALTAGFLRRAAAHGARLYAPLDIVDVQSTPRRVLSLASNDAVIESSWTVFCTGYELPKIVNAPGHRIVSTWAIATAPQPERLWPEQCLIWEASDPYLYVRATHDGRVICGGEDTRYEASGEHDPQLAAKSAVLRTKLHRLLPRLNTQPAFSWNGLFGQTDNGLPLIGPIPGHARCMAVVGFGGNGITFSMLAAGLVAAAIGGQRDPDARLFAL